MKAAQVGATEAGNNWIGFVIHQAPGPMLAEACLQPVDDAGAARDHTVYESSAVYSWSRQVGFAQEAPVKGVAGSGRTSPVTGPTYVDATIAGKRLRRGARLWTDAYIDRQGRDPRFLRQDRPMREELTAGAASLS